MFQLFSNMLCVRWQQLEGFLDFLGLFCKIDIFFLGSVANEPLECGKPTDFCHTM